MRGSIWTIAQEHTSTICIPVLQRNLTGNAGIASGQFLNKSFNMLNPQVIFSMEHCGKDNGCEGD